ncbi:FkbM family methyltransferase [Hyphomicrobium sp.]|uniref:FkbM family methyltransferase n=1 Tax=Hyphomicrobium sp. TaxID=82 RepID=UPI0025B9A382|nr:FkbM family methyltransferase [Hyphomicrobium sp.]MCC7252731.1 FkbM family methyltransferase [Hyphomicrobium sp.]
MEEAAPWGQCHPRGMAALAFAALKHRLVRGALKKPVYRFIQQRCPAQDVEFQGLKLRCHISDNGPERFVIFQERRSAWDALNMSVDRLRPGDTFVDVGANFGLFSAMAAKKVGAEGRVVSIEPHPELVRRLKFNMDANGFRHVTIFESAVGDKTGEAVLYANTSSFAESSLRADATQPRKDQKATAVPIATLLDIVERAGLSRIDALKIDIEGYEDRALVPFFDTAPRGLWPKRLLLETIHADDWATDCVSKLVGCGYAIERRTQSDALLVLPP